MGRRYFGTDGVRGRVGEHPMTVDFALQLASAAARVLAPEGGTVLIGKDTRLSGYMFESALEAGFVAAGVNVMLIGPLPTPGIAYMTRRFNCSFGVVISASHNLYDDNGIKFFDASGGKLSDELEERIETELAHSPITRTSRSLGRATRADRSRTLYQEFCASTLPSGIELSGLKIVIDCANGASYKVGPRILADLGAEIVPIGCSPNGRNINAGCGSTAPDLLQLTVPGVRANVGLALDGDGDRLVMVDHLGRIVDGDQLLYVLARALKQAGTLCGPVVGTVDEQHGARGGAACERHRVPARRGRGPLRARDAARDAGGARRRDFGPHPVPRQDHHRRRAGERPAGARGHEADRPAARGACLRHAEISAGAAQREGCRGVSIPPPCPRCRRRWRASRSAWATTAAWCCAPRARSR